MPMIFENGNFYYIEEEYKPNLKEYYKNLGLLLWYVNSKKGDEAL